MNKHKSNEPHGTTLMIHVVPNTDLDILMVRVKEVASQIIAAHADHINITGNLEITDEYQAPLDESETNIVDDAGRLVFKE